MFHNVMENILLMEKNREAEELSKKFGFSQTLFVNTDFVMLSGTNKKEILHQSQEAKRKKQLAVYKANTEEMLRFVLEKTPVDMIFGIELIHPEDTFHYVRAGLDQVLCQLAANNNKIIAFSFKEILDSRALSKLLARIAFTMRLCQKYRVKTFFSNFSEEMYEMRSAKDSEAFVHVLQKL